MRLPRKLHKENFEGTCSVRSSKTKTKATRMSHSLSGVILWLHMNLCSLQAETLLLTHRTNLAMVWPLFGDRTTQHCPTLGNLKHLKLTAANILRYIHHAHNTSRVTDNIDTLPPFQIQVQSLACSYFVNLISAYINEYLHQTLKMELPNNNNKRAVESEPQAPTCAKLMMGTDLSSLRILSISVRSLSVSRCKVAKWCSCIIPSTSYSTIGILFLLTDPPN